MASSKEDEAFADDASEGFPRRNSSTRRSIRDQGGRALRYTGKTTVRGLEWLFGIESTETEDDRLKWEARQRRLRRLRTRNQLVPQPRQRAGRVSVEREPGAARRTGRDPDSVVVVPPDPKPHVWTLAWRGIKHVAQRIWEGKPPPAPHVQPKPKERFFEIEGSSDEDEDDVDAIVPKLQEHHFFGEDSKDFTDGASGRLDPPSHIPRQRPIQEHTVEVDPLSHNREFHGLGLAGTVLRFDYRRVSKSALDRLDKLYQHRPFFTYWVSFVHILVMIVVAAVYGHAPYGFDYQTETASIVRTNLGAEPVQRTITTNVWIGPSQEDLVLLGARYAPCMRRDERLIDLIEEDRVEESNSGCCIRNSDFGCVQVNNRSDCTNLFARFIFNDTSADPNRVVCGQSPRTCESPRSEPPHVWSEDITRWPLCHRSSQPSSSRSEDDHLSCDLVGRPCCIGILAKCVIVSLDYCNFMKGKFHEEANLCSQVNCLTDTCGLIEFVDEEEPDQFYRIWLSLFLHAGWIQLLFTIVFHALIMRDVEKHIGWFRIGLIYLGSGFAGNIFSGTFIPYLPVVGPAGSIMGTMATLIVYIILEWKRFNHPFYEIAKLAAIILVVLILGLFPYVDNFAHLGGLVAGFLLSAIFVPYYPLYEGEDYHVIKGQKDKFRKIKIYLVAICIPIFVALYTLFFILFYVVQPNCYACQYLTCIPFTDTICQDQRPTPDNRDMNL